ncbi:MAG: hypothetical protein WCV92_00195 [Candidatus Buchananbacteria bacterium]|jgi:hypothetical protein
MSHTVLDFISALLVGRAEKPVDPIDRINAALFEAPTLEDRVALVRTLVNLWSDYTRWKEAILVFGIDHGEFAGAGLTSVFQNNLCLEVGYHDRLLFRIYGSDKRLNDYIIALEQAGVITEIRETKRKPVHT